jgi:hypothetical protein
MSGCAPMSTLPDRTSSSSETVAAGDLLDSTYLGGRITISKLSEQLGAP